MECNYAPFTGAPFSLNGLVSQEHRVSIKKVSMCVGVRAYFKN